jgi:hypothetical protein
LPVKVEEAKEDLKDRLQVRSNSIDMGGKRPDGVSGEAVAQEFDVQASKKTLLSVDHQALSCTEKTDSR